MDNLTYGLIESNSKLEKENQTLKLSHDDLERQLSSMCKINNSLLKKLNALKEQLKGGVIVPRNPTHEMLRAAYKHVMDCHATPESAYKVMLEEAEQSHD